MLARGEKAGDVSAGDFISELFPRLPNCARALLTASWPISSTEREGRRQCAELAVHDDSGGMEGVAVLIRERENQ